jgi:hypothetical protein
MLHLPKATAPPVGLGMLSVVLGTVGLILIFMPVLGEPLSALGLFFGLLGTVLALLGRHINLRWSVAGLLLCSIALGSNVAVDFAPEGYVRDRQPPRMWRQPPDRPWVPPPAKPGFWD